MEVSNNNVKEVLSDNEEEKNEKFKENELKQTEEKADSEQIPDKNTAFLIFKTESSLAKETESGILQCSDDLKKRKSEAKEYLEQCNLYKSKLDDLKVKLNEKKLNKLNLGDDMTNIIDEEECKLINDFKEVKEAYKEYLDKFKFTKAEIASLRSSLDLFKVKFVESFENWFVKKYGIKLEEHELKLSKVSLNLMIIE